MTAAPRKKYKKYTTGTYIGLIASAIEDSPDKRLTFKQIMEKLEPYVFGPRKGIENNIRVCLSSNRCFAKEPVDPDYPNPKKNYWKVDESGITPKQFRRHFKYFTNVFPGLSVQAHGGDKGEDQSPDPEPLTPVSTVAGNGSQAKFTGPFSIESMLKSESGVTRMRSASLEEQPLYINAATNSTHLYEYNAMECYYPVSAVACQSVSPQGPCLAPFGLCLPSRITYEFTLFSSDLL